MFDWLRSLRTPFHSVAQKRILRPRRRSGRARSVVSLATAVERLEDRTLLAHTPVIAGEYLFNGLSTRVEQSHDVLTFINEHGSRANGRFLSDTRVEATGWGGLKGTLSNGDIRWDNGGVWSKAPAPSGFPDISGDYLFNGRPTHVTQTGNSLTFINENGGTSPGSFQNNNTQVVATGWGGLVGTLTNGDIVWANGSIWFKDDTPPPPPPPADFPDIAGNYRFNGLATRVEQSGVSLTFFNENGGSSEGSFVNTTQVVATRWGGLVGTLTNGDIAWANGSIWVKEDTPPPADFPDISGNYTTNGRVARVEQPGGGSSLTFINENGGSAAGMFVSPTHVQVPNWGGLTGTLSDGNILWDNGSVWTKVTVTVDTYLEEIRPNVGGRLVDGDVRHQVPNELVFQFTSGVALDPNSLAGIQIVRSGLDGGFGQSNDVVMATSKSIGAFPNEVRVQFTGFVIDDLYQITIYGAGANPLKTAAGTPFNQGANFVLWFELNHDDQVIEVDPPLAGSNEITVRFDDDLNPTTAVDPKYYRLINTQSTTTTSDDVAQRPLTVTYDAATKTAVLEFASIPAAGTYHLQVGDVEAATGQPAVLTSVDDENSSFLTATNVDTLTQHGALALSQIETQGITPPPPQGGPVSTVSYNFQSVYGTDAQGNPLLNAMTEQQKARAREVFEVYAFYLGIDVVETADQGITIATGDLRAVDPALTSGPGGPAGAASGGLDGLAVMDLGEGLSEAPGGTWFQAALSQIGANLTNGGFDLSPAQPFLDGQHTLTQIRRGDTSDIDLYQFQLPEAGTLSVDVLAQRLGTSGLDTVLTLFGPYGTVVAQNDNATGSDSALELDLPAGTYYLGVTSAGNLDYNPFVSDSGAGGTTLGDYELRLDFTARSFATAGGAIVDGDVDGVPGGIFDYWWNSLPNIAGDYTTKGAVSADPEFAGVVKLPEVSPGFESTTRITQDGNSLTLYNEQGGSSPGVFLDPKTIVATGWNNLTGTITDSGIHWSDGTTWSLVRSGGGFGSGGVGSGSTLSSGSGGSGGASGAANAGAGTFQLLQVLPNIGDPLQDGDVRFRAPHELVFQFSPGEAIDPNSLSGIAVERSGFDGTFDDGNEIVVAPGWVGIGDRPNEVIFRFAENLPDDVYQITIAGAGGPVLNFDGQGFTGATPPDTVGDVGIDHYIQAVNDPSGSRFTIYNKSDGSVAQGPTILSSLAPAGSPGEIATGDPVVLYDQAADQWVMTELTDPFFGNFLNIYVSETSDPTGNWFYYSVPTPEFPDYPKIAVWDDAYYITTNEFDSVTGEPTPAVYALDRTNMLVNGPVRTAQRFAATGLAGFLFQAFTPADRDGATDPPAGSPGYFMRHVDDEAHSPGANDAARDFVEVWEFVVDFDDSANSSFTRIANIAVTEFDSDLNGLTAFSAFPQPGTNVQLDPLREVIMHRLQYRNFGSHETLVGNFVTDVDGSDHGGVRWFELRKSGTGNWTLHQEGTIAPDDENRWMGAVAMDGDGNIMIGYNVTSTTVSPGLRYTGRFETDPLGEMLNERVLVDGSGFSNSFRWGDYSAMSIDPVDDSTFWFTAEYANGTGNWATRIAAFTLDSLILPEPLRALSGAAFNNGVDQTLAFELDLGAQVVAVDPQPVLRNQVVTVANAAQLADGDTIAVTVRGATVVYELDPNNDGAAGGNTAVVFPADSDATTVAAAIAAAIDAQAGVSATSADAAVTVVGDSFSPVVAVSTTTAGAITRTEGGLVQRSNQIVVHFNNDDLDPTVAAMPGFYQLILTGDTLDPADDVIDLPDAVDYDADSDTAVLTFDAIPAGTFRLRVGVLDQPVNDVDAFNAGAQNWRLGFTSFGGTLFEGPGVGPDGKTLRWNPGPGHTSPAALIIGTELETPGTTGANDVPLSAESVPVNFGTGAGQDNAVDITGNLANLVTPTQIGPFLEGFSFPFPRDDGSILLANPTNLVAGRAVRINGNIGDGPHGSSGTALFDPGDFDFFRINNLAAGDTIVIDVDTPLAQLPLDSSIAVWDAAGNLLYYNDDDPHADPLHPTSDSFIKFLVPTAGTYFVSIHGFNPFGDLPNDPFDSASGNGVGSEGSYTLTIGVNSFDRDFYEFDLRAGDIFGANVLGAGNHLRLFDATGKELIGSNQDLTGAHPVASPLPGGGNAALSYVIPADGTYFLSVDGVSGTYNLQLRDYRPELELQFTGNKQIIFLDFDGESIDTSIFGQNGIAHLSGLDTFLDDWKLDLSDRDAVINAIVNVFTENIRTDILGGPNANFDIEILNSRDHADPFGQTNVSRVIIGGSIAELGIPTIGIAESIDVGNFETEESAVVLLDLLSAPFGDPNSLNTYTIDPLTSTIIDLIGVGVGNVAAHEAGHFFAAWHTNQFNPTPNIMDQGGNMPNTLGLGPNGVFESTVNQAIIDGVGQIPGGDDVNVDFAPPDVYVFNEGFTGTENTLAALAFGLSVGTNPLFDDDNSSFTTASDLLVLGSREFVVNSQIQPQAVLLPPLPGGIDEPGHRDLPIDGEQYFLNPEGPAALGTEPVLPDTIQTIFYNFQDVYGVDPQENDLLNAITEQQKQRAREIFELYSYYLGIEAVETENLGITIATGDVRAIDPNFPTGVDGVVGASNGIYTNGGLVVLDNADFTDPLEDEYGAAWFRTAMHEIGHNLGLGHSFDISSIMGSGLTGEPVFPGDVDLVSARRLWRNDSTDIDLYRFELADAGLFTAEVFAERLSNPSLLNSALTLFDADGDIVARNDDYFSNDAYLELTLDAGVYFIGVTSTGNLNYNPVVSDTGAGGTTDGDYQLRLNFLKTPAAGEILVDTTGTAFDGDADGIAGGAYEFWFQAGNTVFVDKASTAAGTPNGTIANPYRDIDDALAATTSRNQDGNALNNVDIVRIVGNGGTDGDLSTPADSQAYLVGVADNFASLQDGRTFVVPKGVTVMINQGAVLKLQNAVINVGSSSQLVDRSGAALQILGTPGNDVVLTSFGNDAIGGDSDGLTDGANPGDWGGIVFQADSDIESAGVFLNYVNNTDISFGGGQVPVDSILDVFNAIHVIGARPTISFNFLHDNADAAISADPRSFADTITVDNVFADPDAYNHDITLRRIGLDVHGNRLVDNSINGLFVRIESGPGLPLNKVDTSIRFDDTDIVHVITENLQIVGNPGGPQLVGLTMQARESGRLRIDENLIVKLAGARIEAERGNSTFIAEGSAGTNGTNELNINFTSIFDDTFGRGGTFDTTNDAGTPVSRDAAPGDWGGIILNATSDGSIDQSRIEYGGGLVPLEGRMDTFNVIEIHQADFRLTNSRLQNNLGAQATDELTGLPSDREGRGTNDNTTIFIRGAQPVIVDNVFLDNEGSVASVDVNSLQSVVKRDLGRSTGAADLIADPLTGELAFSDNAGPLVRRNRFQENALNALRVRGGEVTTEVVFDDADIVHVVFDEITIPNLHTYGGVRLQSTADTSLVVKLSGVDAGFTAGGTPLDIDDRIGGVLQVIGQPLFPVVLTSLNDNSVGAGFNFDGLPQNDTANGGIGTGGLLPTGPEVNNGTLIDNDVAPTIVGHFEAQPVAGGEIGSLPGGGQSGVTAQGRSQLFVNQDFIFDFLNFVDVGSDGNALNLGATTITSPPTLISDDLVVSTGSFTGSNGTINWTAETRFDDGLSIMFNTITFSSTGALGNLQFINYLDEDVLAVGNPDVLKLVGTPGAADFRAFTLNQQEGIGFSQGGIYTPGSGLVNATYDGWAADQFSELRDVIQAAGTTYTVAGNIDTADLPPIIDPFLGSVFGPNDVTTAFSWTVDPQSNSATITTFLELVARPANPAAPGDWRSLRLESDSHDRNVEVVGETEPTLLRGITVGIDPRRNDIPPDAQFLGQLARDEDSGDENRRLGFEVHGFIANDTPGDQDVYSFDAIAGTEVWIDIDRTDPALNTVVELIDPLADVLAGSFNNGSLTGLALPMTKDPQFGGDYYTSNPNDAGMRVTLPGIPGRLTTYFVRVSSFDATGDDAGETSGQYQMQIRLRQIDEHAGSTIRSADIRYATSGIELLGLPAHSPLLGESAEDVSVNNTFAQAQDIGNLLTVDRNAIGVSGELASLADNVDFYSFTLDVDLIEAINTVNGGTRTWATLFDIDYADGLARPDLTLSIFDSLGRLIYIGRESSIADDQPAPGQGVDFDDETRGSAGKLDPYIGTIQLPAGVVTSTTTASQEYFVAVSSNTQLPQALDAFLQFAPTNSLIRLEPVNSIQRIVEEHVGTQGYVANGVIIDPTTQLFDVFDNISIDAHVKPFTLQDVTLFTASGSSLDTFDPQLGFGETNVGSILEVTVTPNVFRSVSDIVLRSDGRLFGISGNRLLEISTAGTPGGITTASLVGLHSIPPLLPSPSLPSGLPTTPQLQPLRVLMNNKTVRQGTIEAMTFERTGFNSTFDVPVYSTLYLMPESGTTSGGTQVTFQKLYRSPDQRADQTTGNASSGFQGFPADESFGDLTIADDDQFGIDANNNFAHILIQAVVPGEQGNNITLNLFSADIPVAFLFNITTTVGVGTTINVTMDSNPAQSVQALVDFLNGNGQINQFIKTGFVGNGATNAVEAFTGDSLTTGNVTFGVGRPYSQTDDNFVMGMSYDDFFGGFELHGVTYTGEIAVFDDASPTANVYHPVHVQNFVNGIGTPGTPVLGVDITSSTFGVDSNFIPPDTMGGVGLVHVVEMINGNFEVFDKDTGASLVSMSLDEFWTDIVNLPIPPDHGGRFDPRVIYDPTVGRWFASSIDSGPAPGGGANNILVAVSDGEDPTLGWSGAQFLGDTTQGLLFNDFDSMGVDEDGVYLATNNFNKTFSVSVYSIPKADLMGGLGVTNMTRFEGLDSSIYGNSLQAAVDFGPSDGRAAFLSAYNGFAGLLARFDVLNAAGPGPAVLTIPTYIDVPSFFAAPFGRQPGPFDNIENVSPRFNSNVVEVNGSLWAVHAVEDPAFLGSALRWYEIDEETSALKQTGLIATPGGTTADDDLDYYDASIAVSPLDGDVVIGSSGSGDNQPISAYATFGTTINGVTTFTQPVVTHQGLGTYFQDFGSGRNRWGDYSATVVDPENPEIFWTFQEFVDNSFELQELISNGDFESGFAGWDVNNDPFGAGQWVINNGTFDPTGPGTPLAPISGNLDALTDQIGPSTEVISEAFVVPNGITSAVLSWSDRIRNFHTSFVDPDQELRVEITDVDGNVIFQVFSTDPGDPLMQIGPNNRSFNVTSLLQSLEGETIAVRFVEQDTLDFFNVTLDNVSLLVNAPHRVDVPIGANNSRWSVQVSEITGFTPAGPYQAPILGDPIRFTGAALGPQNLFDGSYRNTIYAIAEDGRMVAFDTDGNLQDVFGPNEGIGDYFGFQEVEPNDSIAAAQDIENFRYLQNFDPTVGTLDSLDAGAADVNTSDSLPHVTIRGTGNNSKDFYSFRVETAGSQVILDIDGGSGFGKGDFDAILTLRDSAGNVIWTNDDMFFTVDAGSNVDLDSLIDTDLLGLNLAAGTYTVEVSAFSGTKAVPVATVIPVGATYSLHVSVANHTIGIGQAPIINIGSTSANVPIQADGATTLVTQDDDSGVFFDSRIDKQLQPGTYVVVVGSFDAQTNPTNTDVVGPGAFGDYQLHVSLSDRTATTDPGPYDEVEVNHPFVRAQHLNMLDFTLALNTDIDDSDPLSPPTSQVVPHLTIDGTGDGTFDYYLFTVTENDTRAILNTTTNGTFDTELFLFAYDPTRNDLEMQTGAFLPDGLAFSPLDFNLWHPTELRGQGADPGHGVNGDDVGTRTGAPDNSRDATVISGSDTLDSRLVTQSQGGLSLYFGFEEFANISGPDPENRYVTYEDFSSQLGVVDSGFQLDLTSNPTPQWALPQYTGINAGGNLPNGSYNIAGGAYGSLVGNEFSLEGYHSTDRPTLYFNYFLDSENVNSATGLMRDSIRVYVSVDGGNIFQELATNNSITRQQSLAAELPSYVSHTASGNTNDFVDVGAERVQELYDNTGGWRQARVDLSEFAGQGELILRWDFSTAGSVNDPNLPGDATGNFFSNRRGQNNDHEGVFIDDIIVGFAERGEMVTGANTNQAGFVTVPQNPDPLAPTQQLTGTYQLEIRRGTEYAVSVTPIGDDIAITRTFDTNERLVSSDVDPDLSPGDPFYGHPLLGDDNFRREQGFVGIFGNQITQVSEFGIIVDSAPRDTGSNFAHPGSVRALPTLNPSRLAPGALIENNVIANFGTGGILFSGDANPANTPLAAVPFGKIVNNTIYGSGSPTGVGIQVTQNASPTVLNNIIANTDTAISVDGTSVTTVIGTTLFQNNINLPVTGTNAILLNPFDPLFLNPGASNFYLKAGSLAIDSSLNRLADRPAFVAVKAPLGIPASDVFAPDYDIFGQLRVDDPSQAPPPGLGFQVFKDRGAIERADIVGPTSQLIVPLDNGPDDFDPDPTEVLATLFPTEFVVKLRDVGGIGIDDIAIASSQFELRRNNVLLTEGIDYLFVYNANSDEVTFRSSVGPYSAAIYTISIDNDPVTGVRDRAGNLLQPNQTDGSVLYTIALGTELTIDDVQVNEGNVGDFPTATFTVTLAAPSDSPVTVLVSTADGTATLADNDYQQNSQTLTFLPGGPLTQTFTVTVVGDPLGEPNETFFVNLTNVTNARIRDAQGVGTIVNDDPPAVSIDNVTVLEPDVGGTASAVFTISLSNPGTGAVTVNFATSNGSATAGLDYTATSDFVSFDFTNPAETLTRQITVPILGDSIPENSENFFVDLVSASGAFILDGQGEGTITDFHKPLISINDVAVLEGNVGASNMAVFTVTMSQPSIREIRVDYQTANGTATAGSDYTAKSGTVVFSVGAALTQQILVTIQGDDNVEPDETFFVNLSTVSASLADAQGMGTIIDSSPSDGFPDISGDYTFNGLPTHVTQSGSSLTFINEAGNSSAGMFLSATEVVATDWGPLNGTLSGGNILWANGSTWVKDSPRFAAGAGGSASTAPLERSQLDAIISQAIAEWNGVLGVDGALQSVTFQVEDLPGNLLGLASAAADTIRIDVDAAGYGWFIDATPGENEEFAFDPASGQFIALPGGAADRMDLLTLVLHELGHIAGLDDLDANSAANDLMAETQAVGVRQLPKASHAALINGDGADTVSVIPLWDFSSADGGFDTADDALAAPQLPGLLPALTSTSSLPDGEDGLASAAGDGLWAEPPADEYSPLDVDSLHDLWSDQNAMHELLSSV
jgi:hypothetical protein